MIAFAGMLLGPAEKAGMKIPEDADAFEEKDYFHFHVFCMFQLGSSMPYPSAHWDNAKIIADIPEEDLRKMTVGELREQLALGYPTP